MQEKHKTKGFRDKNKQDRNTLKNLNAFYEVREMAFNLF